MTISIYHVTFRFSGTPNTLLQTVHVPNWFERVLLRRKRIKVNYIGHKEIWKLHPNGTELTGKVCKRLAEAERQLEKIGKKNNQRILKFR